MKTYTFILVTGLIFGFFLGHYFSCSPPCPDAPKLVKSDTVTHVQPKEVSAWIENPEPESITTIEGGKIPAPAAPQKQNAEVVAPVPAASTIAETVTDNWLADSAWVREQWIARNYQETYQFSNGVVTVETTVGQNRMLRQRAVLDSLKQTVITNTVQVPEKKKGHLYGGFTVQGNRFELITGAGPSLLYINRQNKGIHATALYGPSGKWNYQAGVLLPLF